MAKYKHIVFSSEDCTDTIWFNRPDVHNAFNPLMIKEITAQLKVSVADPRVRLIIIRGKGMSFSSGADINYMREMKNFSAKDNLEDSLKLADLFYSIYSCPKPLLTIAHGNVTGGAIGIVAAADYALCTTNTVFRFSETKLGLVPATISPYIIRRIGEFRAKELILTGRPVSGEEAERYNLVNKSVPENEVDNSLKEISGFFMSSAPKATIAAKSLINSLVEKNISYDTVRITAGIIAETRVSPEAQEGLSAFLGKRKPNWTGV